MTTAGSKTYNEQILDVGGTKVQMVKGGNGEPLLVLHGEMGHLGWLHFHEALAQNHTLHIPSHPGFGKSERLDWIMNIRDLAGWYVGVLEELELDQINMVGLSLGGWLAAEMAAMCPHQFKSLTIVDAPGIQPPVGEIYDMFLVVAREYITASFLNPAGTPEFHQVCPDDPTHEQRETWEVAREEACRLTWRPYMFDSALPYLLRRVRNLPTLIIHGSQDPIVPPSVAQVYQESIAGSQLVFFDNCGHHPEIEQSDKFVQVVEEFLSGR